MFTSRSSFLTSAKKTLTGLFSLSMVQNVVASVTDSTINDMAIKKESNFFRSYSTQAPNAVSYHFNQFSVYFMSVCAAIIVGAYGYLTYQRLTSKKALKRYLKNKLINQIEDQPQLHHKLINEGQVHSHSHQQNVAIKSKRKNNPHNKKNRIKKKPAAKLIQNIQNTSALFFKPATQVNNLKKSATRELHNRELLIISASDQSGTMHEHKPDPMQTHQQNPMHAHQPNPMQTQNQFFSTNLQESKKIEHTDHAATLLLFSNRPFNSGLPLKLIEDEAIYYLPKNLI